MCVCVAILLSVISWLIGPRPEFVDPKFVAKSDGRESNFIVINNFILFIY